ncbi:DUF3592 domain-containing protein [Corynebacterium sp. TAE3-ERU12]|uniref:DUF3592 domain-containing protein n=1 Tax=Corynebacterium sp. TAE3-ERU12 TaxID=2849491 RepID=UPI001C43DB4D|nr:DUF3592 domain-containing protein [Corynebacterium sp. TAE3-ERU12]MBV7295741.1 DUF3592 domain-containing protein [Corynebacterium sp. TAE3-ERU12]
MRTVLEGAVCMAIGLSAIIAAGLWFVLRRRADAHRFHTTGTVTGAVGRPGDDLRAMVITFTDRDGSTRSWTDTLYTAFALGHVGDQIDIAVDPPSADGEPGAVYVPRESNPTFMLNVLLGMAGVAFLISGMFIFTEASF